MTNSGMPMPQHLGGFTYVIQEPTPPPAGGAGTGAVAGGPGAGSTDRVFMLFHGTGGDEYDLLDLGSYVAPGATLVSPRGRAPEGRMNRWFARHAEGVLDEDDIRRRAKELDQFIPEVLAAHGLQGRRLWALGFSNGANMAAAMLLLYPKIFHGAILMRPMLPLLPEVEPNLENVPVYIAAGTQDTMIPQESTRRLVQVLEKAGAQLTTRWAQAGHGFGREEIELVREWLSLGTS